jgi:hypothetical protein
MPQRDNQRDLPKSRVDAPERHFQIEANASADLPIRPQVIYCEADGVIVIQDDLGESLPYTMVRGDSLVFRGSRVISISLGGTFYGHY